MLSPPRPPSVLIVDDFYADPHALRALALSQPFHADERYHKGQRTRERFLFAGVRERFEALLGAPIRKWEEYGNNGCFQFCVGGDPLVYHSDFQTHAATIYLTPDAPLESGLRTHRSKATGLRRSPSEADAAQRGEDLSSLIHRTYGGKLLDPFAWDTVDHLGNVFNRLVIFDAQQIHSAAGYFGHTADTGRLFQMFFFDV